MCKGGRSRGILETEGGEKDPSSEIGGEETPADSMLRVTLNTATAKASHRVLRLAVARRARIMSLRRLRNDVAVTKSSRRICSGKE